MAIWQYQIFIVPREEINSFFKEHTFISNSDFNEIRWWKYRQLSLSDFNDIKFILPQRKTWTKDIILFGDEDSDCVELFYENNKFVEISVKFDLRNNFTQLLRIICDFGKVKECMFLNNDLKIITPNFALLLNEIENYPNYKLFLNKINPDDSII